MNRMTGLASIAGVVALAVSLGAHHGDAGRYEDKLTTVKGTVVELQLINPHSMVVLDAKDESGNAVHWVIETQNLVQQSTLGWTNSTFKPGDQVDVDVTPAKNGRPIGRFKGRIVINGQAFKP